MDNIEKNKQLIAEYPFLLPRSVWTGKELEDYDYSYTLLDQMPTGWNKAFGEEMIKELKEILEKADFVDKYFILQIKEKYGLLCWYDSGVPKSIYDAHMAWEKKYRGLSRDTCINCGEKATHTTTDWIAPFCDECDKPFYEEIGEE